MNRNKSEIRILIVEDEAITAADIKQTLQDLNYQLIESADNGLDALAAAKKNRPDLVLMDIKLKGAMEGIEAAAYLWDKYQIPAIFLTSHSDEKTLSHAKLLNPFGYILKPFLPDQLKTTIELALDRYESQYPKPVVKLLNTEANNVVSDDSTKLNFLKRIPLFNKISADYLSGIASGAQFKEFVAKKTIIQEGEDGRVCFVVVTGRIACCKSAENGKELILNLLAPGDFYGAETLLEDRPSNFMVRAERPSRLLMLPQSSLKLVLDKTPELYKEFLELANIRLEESSKLARDLAYEKVELRIAGALIALMRNFGKSSSQYGTNTIDVMRYELADLAGTTTETVIRVTRSLEKQKILDLSQQGVIGILNLEELEDLCSL